MCLKLKFVKNILLIPAFLMATSSLAYDDLPMLKEKFEKELSETTWGINKEKSLKARMVEPEIIAELNDSNLAVDSIVCRQTTCKVLVEQTNLLDAEKIGIRFLALTKIFSAGQQMQLRITDPVSNQLVVYLQFD